MIRRAKQRQSATESNTDAICAEKGCRPFHVQTPPVHRTNAICTWCECRLIICNYMTMKNYNLKLLSIEYKRITAKRG